MGVPEGDVVISGLSVVVTKGAIVGEEKGTKSLPSHNECDKKIYQLISPGPNVAFLSMLAVTTRLQNQDHKSKQDLPEKLKPKYEALIPV